MKQYDRSELIELLQKYTVKITFTKVDGSTRVMDCTLREDILPVVTVPESAKPRRAAPPASLLPVWSVQDRGWRSIKLYSITNVLVLGSNNV